MVTICGVARAAGVSLATVSHVVNGTRPVALETVARVRWAMKTRDHHSNVVTQSLRTRKTYAIRMVVSDITNPFFGTLVRDVEDGAVEGGYCLIMCNSDESPEKEDYYVRLLRRWQMDGFLISPFSDGSSKALRRLPEQNVPFVFNDRRAVGIDADAVLSDSVDGTYQATKHLIERGHQRIGITLGIREATTAEERLVGYRKALEEARIPFREELIAYGGYCITGGMEWIEQFLAAPVAPTATFSTDDRMTVGVLKALARYGIRIPNELAVISFDVLDLGKLFQPSFTAVEEGDFQGDSGSSETVGVSVDMSLTNFHDVMCG